MLVGSVVLIGTLTLGTPLVADAARGDRSAVQNHGQTPAPAPATTALGGSDSADSPDVVKRVAEQVERRLQTIEDRVREDDRLRRAGALVGLGAAALGAARGDDPLIFLGTHALRIALADRLARVRAQTGFTVEPAIGYRRVAITFTRRFE